MTHNVDVSGVQPAVKDLKNNLRLTAQSYLILMNWRCGTTTVFHLNPAKDAEPRLEHSFTITAPSLYLE